MTQRHYASYARQVTQMMLLTFVPLLSVGLRQRSIWVGDKDMSLCEHKLTLTINGTQAKLPYYRNHALDRTNTQIERAVIVLHGTYRNASDYFDLMTDATASQTDSTLVIAPLFPDEAYVDQADSDVLFWSGNGWRTGGQSLSTDAHPRSTSISSFAVLDQLLNQLADQRLFPRLRTITIAGHSAGGQFVQRYAAANQVHQHLAVRGIDMRYVAANASSYLYFDEARVVPGTPDCFAPPAPEQRQRCPEFNDYRYGLSNLNTYMAAIGAETLRAQYQQRQVVYLLGARDNDPQNERLDRRSAAQLQGAHRLARGLIYRHYLHYYFGAQIQRLHRVSVVPDVGHDARAIFNSREGRQAFFGTLRQAPTPALRPGRVPQTV